MKAMCSAGKAAAKASRVASGVPSSRLGTP